MSIATFLQGSKRSLMDRLRGVDSEEEQTPGSDAHANGTPAAESDRPSLTQDLSQSPLPQTRPSLRDELTSKPSMQLGPAPPPKPSLTDELKAKQDAVGQQPTTTRGKIGKALLTALPTALGGIFGGAEGASGAAEGTLEYQDTKRQQENLQRKSIGEELEAERQRQERMQEREMTTQATIAGQQARLAGVQATNSLRSELADSTNSLRREIAASADTTKRRGQDAALREKGFKLDQDGNPVPLDRTELSPKQQADLATTEALTAYRQAQSEHAQAQADFERTKNDPKSPAFQLAQKRLDVATQRLSLSKQQFEMRAFGTNQGEALPGSMIGDDGKPVGTSFQGNVRPTGQQRNKGNMASSAREQIADLIDVVQRHPDIFGPGHGQLTEISNWLGTQDRDVQVFKNARAIAAEHLAGTFGGRSEAALTALDNAVGQFKDNPEAMLAGLQQLDKAAKLFEDVGKLKTTGSNAVKPSLKNELGDMIQVQIPGQPPGPIHKSQWQAFKKKYPNAVQVKPK